ncbi:GIY-YIG nuclease family protein [Pseudoneobacillus sp. C159]
MICDRNTRRFYVGASSKSCLVRCEAHLYKLKNGIFPSPALQKAYWDKHEIEFVQLIEMPNVDKKEILKFEKRLIHCLRATDAEYGFNTKGKSLQKKLASI